MNEGLPAQATEQNTPQCSRGRSVCAGVERPAKGNYRGKQGTGQGTWFSAQLHVSIHQEAEDLRHQCQAHPEASEFIDLWWDLSFNVFLSFLDDSNAWQGLKTNSVHCTILLTYIYREMYVHVCNVSGKIQGNESVVVSDGDRWDSDLWWEGYWRLFLSTLPFLPFCTVGIFFFTQACFDYSVSKTQKIGLLSFVTTILLFSS